MCVYARPALYSLIRREHECGCTESMGVPRRIPPAQWQTDDDGSVPTQAFVTHARSSFLAAAGYAQQCASIAAPSSRTWCARCIVTADRADGRRRRRCTHHHRCSDVTRRYYGDRISGRVSSRERAHVLRFDVSKCLRSDDLRDNGCSLWPDVVVGRTTHWTLTRRRTATNTKNAAGTTTDDHELRDT